jgi:hypothetical protein
MLRRILCVFAMTTMVGAFAAEGPGAKPTSNVEMVPDPNWYPRPGEQAAIWGEDAPAAPNYLGYRNWQKFTEANDVSGLNDLYARKAVVKIPQGTPVLILKKYSPAPTVTYAGDAASLGDAVIRDALAERPNRYRYPIEVRILDGEFRDQVRFVPEVDVARLRPVARARAKAPRPAPKPVDPAARAATALRSAQSLERAGKIPGALTLYRQIVRDYPGTPQAGEAAGRIKALGGR